MKSARSFAFLLLLAVSLPAVAEEKSVVTIGARVLPRVVLNVVAGPAKLEVTAEDVKRGYVDVRTPSRVAVRSNANYLMNFEIGTPAVSSVELVGLDVSTRIAAPGGWIHLARPERNQAVLEIGYRVHLSPEAAPGTYSWPVEVSAVPFS